ncbi:MAG TPA: hypothetical protein VMA72_04340 [Streptosporangiaceae bacterium]|nr:hypothetical protein [Streptosporangiaceae bacterium]
MTSPLAWQGALRKRRVQVVVPAMVAAFAMSVLAACSVTPARVELPAKPAAATTAVSREPVSATPRQQVVAALTGYTAALGRAEQSRSRARARRLLHPYLAASRIGGLVGAVSSIWAKGDRFYGEDVLHIIGVRIDGHRAFVHDCDDTSGMGLDKAATGEALPGSAGVQHANLVTRLDEVAGHWLVESQLPEGAPCVP